MGFFNNIGAESVILCKKLADFNDLKIADEKSNRKNNTWTWALGHPEYIIHNTGAFAVVYYLLDSNRINIDDLINYVYRSIPQFNYEKIKNIIDINIFRVAKLYNSKTKTLYCYGGPKGGMTDDRAEHIFNDATELLKYLNIKYIKKGSSKQHNIRIVFN